MNIEGRLKGRFRRPKGYWDLQAPRLEGEQQGMLDPANDRAVFRVEPYSGMASGDRVTLVWRGIDVEGGTGAFEIQHFVSCAQVGKPILFVVRDEQIDPFDGGSVAVHYTLESAACGAPIKSPALQLQVGDAAHVLPAPRVDETSSGWLAPERVSEGVRVIIRPYATMAVGDTVFLTWQGSTPSRSVGDSLSIAPCALGGEVSFWIDPHYIASNLGEVVTVSYFVQRPGLAMRYSESVQVRVGVREPQVLALPQVLEASEGVLEVHEALDGVTVLIDEPSIAPGDLVYLKCDGTHFNHRDSRDVNDRKASVFIVPYRFWREHQDSTVRVSYRVMRQDGTGEVSEVVEVQVRRADLAL
ncbi:hypothetical protein SAMN04487857_102207 [Pseudomonas sp. ok272]|uniref:hypothetical protein n=1 Tax=unclassified Pseudomonas TaxID=196821 RepID=UPI0008B5F94A|nr:MULTISPECIES: hypothetical protein [unclassified Pseudomonas]SEM48085.1 hypothetical protein SAMN04487857_102207 [Pseudomonas sp. ok272]SFM19652.1 hypothetical protein SAMN04487858_101208 [Pseudomonas sp. ok602]